MNELLFFILVSHCSLLVYRRRLDLYVDLVFRHFSELPY